MNGRNHLHHGDCIEGMAQLDAGSVDLVFADPPFNIGYDYDVYEDRKHADEYLAWTKNWGEQVKRVLKADGTFWLAIGDDFAAELKVLFTRELGFSCRSWVIWYYTFGVNCTRKFSQQSHAPDPLRQGPGAIYIQRRSDQVPSARQLVYQDTRANPSGRLPDDTWILRPQDLPDSFQPDEDTWYFPRVCGTFKERAGFHGCQMPERVLGRIIEVSSNPAELVLDPFAGSGSTLMVAKKLGRDYLGFEFSENYAQRIRERLESVKVGQALDGVDDPKTSVPNTANVKRLDVKKNGAVRSRKKRTSSPRR